MSSSQPWSAIFEKIDANRWRIPRAYDPRMRVDGIIYFMVGGEKPEDRFVNFLKELIFLLETRQAVAEELEFEPENEARWRVRGRFGRVIPKDVLREIKSPTYHGLHVQASPDWRVEIYFDL